MQPTKHNIFKDEKTIINHGSVVLSGTYCHKVNGKVIEVKSHHGKHIVVEIDGLTSARAVDFLNDYVWFNPEEKQVH